MFFKNKNKKNIVVGHGDPDVPHENNIDVPHKNITEIAGQTRNDGEFINETELIAVITASVAAILEKPVSGFRVVAFKQRTGWKLI